MRAAAKPRALLLPALAAANRLLSDALCLLDWSIACENEPGYACVLFDLCSRPYPTTEERARILRELVARTRAHDIAVILLLPPRMTGIVDMLPELAMAAAPNCRVNALRGIGEPVECTAADLARTLRFLVNARAVTGQVLHLTASAGDATAVGSGSMPRSAL